MTNSGAPLASTPGVNRTELTEQAILAEVKRRTGISEQPDPALLDRLRRLTHHLEHDLGLSDHGQAMAFETISDLLTNRALLLADRQTYPEIQDERIERPLIVAGFGRSGTTLLQGLLREDPNNRVPQWWESRFPSPPPAIAPADDTRLQAADQEIKDLLETIPGLLAAHPYFEEGGRTAAECEAFGMLDLRSNRRTICFRIPAIISIDLRGDPIEYYQFHYKVLQGLQWRAPRRRWALKGVEHLMRLDALRQIYPDAIVIWLHRDPQMVFPSNMELVCIHDDGITGKRIDRRAVGGKLLDIYTGMLDRAMAATTIDHPNVHHLRYADFSANPVQQIAAIYERYGLTFDDATAGSMQAWLDNPENRSDRHGKFKYSFEAFGFTKDQLEERVSGYRRRFDIPIERPSR